MSIIDIGAGTGHLAARVFREAKLPVEAIHFVDVHPPCSGRSFGIRGCPTDLQAVEWTIADYRELLDRESWIERNRHYAMAFLCRLLDNLSTFELAEFDAELNRPSAHESLASSGTGCSLRVSSTRTETAGGTTLLQDPFRDYFEAIAMLQQKKIQAIGEQTKVMPVRRFNPASLTTRNGKSVLAQLLRIAQVIFIDDMDLSEDDLMQHRLRFGLSGTSALRIEGDGHRTESKSFLLGRTARLAGVQKGRRIW